MAKLVWGRPTERLIEYGVDRGVLYVEDGPGVAWNGLTSVTEKPSGAEPTAVYADNIKYITLISVEEYAASIEALSYPPEFMECLGQSEIALGVFAGQQLRSTFDFSYRTRIESALDANAGYKLHLIYNALASPSESAHKTVNDSPEAETYSFELSTTAVVSEVLKSPTASLTLDSRKMHPAALRQIENILYGTDRLAPRMPTVEEVQFVVDNASVPLSTKMRPFSSVRHETTYFGNLGPGQMPVWATANTPWNRASRFEWFAGKPEAILPSNPEVGCIMRTTGAQNLQAIYGSFKINKPEFTLNLVSFSPTDVTIYVDRHPLSLTAPDPSVTTREGENYFAVTGLGDGIHQVDFVIGAGSIFTGINHATGATVTPGDPPEFRMGVVGDSYTDLGIGNYQGGLNRELFRLTGWAIVQLGQGSTGYTNDGASSGDTTKGIYGSYSRYMALDRGKVDLLLVIGSVNDGAATDTLLKTTAKAYYDKIAERNIPLIVAPVEPLNLYGETPANWDRIDNAIISVAEAHSGVIAVIPWRRQKWLTGTGNTFVPRGDGNQDILVGLPDGSDTIHLNYEGNKYIGGLFVDALKPIVYEKAA